jgi:hypothetical protein
MRWKIQVVSGWKYTSKSLRDEKRADTQFSRSWILRFSKAFSQGQIRPSGKAWKWGGTMLAQNAVSRTNQRQGFFGKSGPFNSRRSHVIVSQKRDGLSDLER